MSNDQSKKKKLPEKWYTDILLEKMINEIEDMSNYLINKYDEPRPSMQIFGNDDKPSEPIKYKKKGGRNKK